MWIYICIALFTLFGVITKQADKIYKISFVIIFLLTALRNVDLGLTDTIIYQAFFQNVPNITEISGFKSEYTWGYILINSIVKTFTDNYLVFQIIYTATTMVLLYIIIENLEFSNKEKCLFLFSYFCFRYFWNTWVILRQNVAILFFWLFLVMLYREPDKKKRILLVILIILVPASFHSSAWVNLIVLPVFYFLSKVPVNIKGKIIPIIGVLMYLFGSRIYGVLLNFMQSIIDSRYLMYTSEASSSNAINFILRFGFYILFIWIYSKNPSKKNKFIVDVTEMMFLIGSINAALATRMFEYYAIGLYTGMAGILSNFTKRSRHLVLFVYGICMMIIMIRFFLITDGGVLADYSLWFGKRIY